MKNPEIAHAFPSSNVQAEVFMGIGENLSITSLCLYKKEKIVEVCYIGVDKDDDIEIDIDKEEVIIRERFKTLKEAKAYFEEMNNPGIIGTLTNNYLSSKGK